MVHLERIWEQSNQRPVPIAGAVIAISIATEEKWLRSCTSVSMLYVFPLMLAAAFLPRWATVLLGAVCALLTEQFSNLPLHSYTGESKHWR
jgi:hypothetical protein